MNVNFQRRIKVNAEQKAREAEESDRERAVEEPGESIPDIRPEGQADGDPERNLESAVEKASEDEVAKLIAEKRELTDTLMRRQADFDNFRKRVERERGEERHRGAAGVVERLLPALDALDLALAADSNPAHAQYQKGFESIRKLLWNMLAKEGLEKIDAAGKPFDPNVHHAIDRVHTDEYPEGTVMDELQAGYMFHGRVLRPAMVRVAAPADHAAI
jgi:molecular chaperone GrpE